MEKKETKDVEEMKVQIRNLLDEKKDSEKKIEELLEEMNDKDECLREI